MSTRNEDDPTGYLFSKTTQEIYALRTEFDIGMLDTREYVEKATIEINKSYESNDEDIEDLGDILIIMNAHAVSVIEKDRYDEDEIVAVLKLRKYAKKRANQKLRDVRENGREFMNSHEAIYQFRELLTAWKETVVDIRRATKIRFPDDEEDTKENMED